VSPEEQPELVRTGLEFSIPLEHLGNPTGDIRLTMFINDINHSYASNQFAGVGIVDLNLGGNGFGSYTGDLSGVILTDFVGNQFVTVTQPQAGPSGQPVPEPAAWVLAAGLCASVVARLRRPR
jgi:hypothetical protein